jgi:pyruvate formate lyase activating enzyme
MDRENKALIFDIKRGCSEDGPGIRTTVFFKGCPLACVWCQNPEGINPNPEHSCNGEAVGYWITLEELLYRIGIDKPFYVSSGGGVTLSGGEATMQMEFVHRLLKTLKQDGIQTAIETCGLFDYASFSRLLLPWLDLIYFDLKLIDEDASKKYTGSSNRVILNNFIRLISQQGVQVTPRIPLIPKITMTESNLTGLARFLRRHGVTDCSLMPYNPTWRDKLKRLGKKTSYHYDRFLTREEQFTSTHYFQQPLERGGKSHAN